MRNVNGTISALDFTKESVNMGFDKNVYDVQYKKDNFDQFNFFMPKGWKEKFKEYAKRNGTTMSELLKEYIADKIGE